MDKQCKYEEEVFHYNGQSRDEVPEDVRIIHVNKNVKEIPRRAFQELDGLQEVRLCEGLVKIGEDAFCACVALEHVDIPSTVKEIDNHAFCNCVELKELDLPVSLEKIGPGAFWGCDKLTRINVQSRLRLIEEDMSQGCVEVDKMDISKDLKKIGCLAFQDSMVAATSRDSILSSPSSLVSEFFI